MAGQHDMISGQLRRRDITDPAVLAAFARVPREAFVVQDLLAKAFDDGPLPIGFGQTISQPYVVALMAQALRLRASDRVLEIGTGSGYAAAILGELVASVDTVERIEELAIGGRMVVPVGRDDDQQLVRITRGDATTFRTEQLGDVRFVPLLGAEGFPSS
jgi:protein-L-isoaspartate(D-aspartate) O-methyltransferase